MVPKKESESVASPSADHAHQPMAIDSNRGFLEWRLFLELSTDAWLLFAAKTLRMFAFGFFAVMSVIYFKTLHFSEHQIGFIFTLTTIGDAVFNFFLTSHTDRLIGRRNGLLIAAMLSILTSFVLVLSRDFSMLLPTAIVGIFSPSGSEMGPFCAIELSGIAQVCAASQCTQIVAWYNLFGVFGAALGALLCGSLLSLFLAMGRDMRGACNGVLVLYCLLQILQLLLFFRLSPSIEAPDLSLPRTENATNLSTTHSLLPHSHSSHKPPHHHRRHHSHVHHVNHSSVEGESGKAPPSVSLSKPGRGRSSTPMRIENESRRHSQVPHPHSHYHSLDMPTTIPHQFSSESKSETPRRIKVTDLIDTNQNHANVDHRNSNKNNSNVPNSFLGLRRSRALVLHLALLLCLDSFAGSFTLQAILSDWFFDTFQTSSAVLGDIVFWCDVLAGISTLFAPYVAHQIGLVRTIVFTQAPSNVLLILVPLMPTELSAIMMLCLRYSISQMDIPSRYAFILGAVDPDERSAATGIINAVRSVGYAFGAYLVQLLLARPQWRDSIFVISGGLKLVYDFLLYWSFASVSSTTDTHPSRNRTPHLEEAERHSEMIRLLTPRV